MWDYGTTEPGGGNNSSKVGTWFKLQRGAGAGLGDLCFTLRLNIFCLVASCAFHIGPEIKRFQLLGDGKGWNLTFFNH